jgi:hypothetical protein
MGIIAKCRVDRLVAIAQDGRAVHVERRPFRFSDRREWNTVAGKLVGGSGETDHEDV